MHKFKWERIRYIACAMLAAVMVSACAPTEPIVITKHDIIAQDDSDLVDCKVDAPPAKADYLVVQQPAADATEVDKLKAALKTAEQRELMLTSAWMSQTKNIITCNVRWKGSREFKAKATERIKALENQKGK